MADIDAFQEEVIRLKPGNFMSMGGAGTGIIGSSTSGGDALLALQRAAIEFVRQYKDSGEVATARKDLTGKIMVAVALDTLSEQRADELLDEIEQLMKERKD